MFQGDRMWLGRESREYGVRVEEGRHNLGRGVESASTFSKLDKHPVRMEEHVLGPE